MMRENEKKTSNKTFEYQIIVVFHQEQGSYFLGKYKIIKKDYVLKF